MFKRILLIIVITASVLLIGLYLSYDYWLEKQLRYQLSEIISEDPNSLYRYSFEELDIDLISGSVDLLGIKVEPRDRGYDSLESETSSVRFLLDLQLEEIELLEFEIMEFIKTKRMTIDAINIHKPSFTYYFNPTKDKVPAQTMPLGEVFSDDFISANIKRFSIKEGNLTIDNYQSPAAALMINYLDVDFIDVYIDQETLQQAAPINYQDIKLKAASISSDISKNFSIITDSLLFDATDKSFKIRDFQIAPKYSVENWAKTFEFQEQWFALTLGSVSINRIDLEHFVRSGEIFVGKIDVEKPNVALYKDKRKPEPPFKKKPLPATIVKSIPLKLNIDSIQLNNGYVAINETGKLTGVDSHISFYDLQGVLTNFSNLPEEERKSNIMELYASSMMYKQADVKLRVRFDLNSPIDEFEASGSVDSVDMSAFNPVLEPMMSIKATDGRIHRMTFEFKAMDTLSTGIMDLEYNNAKINVLRTDTSANNNKKGFMSFAANTIIKTNNNMNKSGYSRGIIRTERVLNKDVWPYIWHNIQSGIISTLAPITNKKEAKNQQKQRRQELKEERKEDKD